MAKEFLNRHLKLENSIKPDVGQECLICHEEVGSLSAETGIIECLIRLPCSHLVGSHCIAIWLHDNNTCPMCRRELFPAQPRPHTGHAVTINLVDNYADEMRRERELFPAQPQPHPGHEVTINRITGFSIRLNRERESWHYLSERIDGIFFRLERSRSVWMLSRLIGRLSLDFDALRDSSRPDRAAACAYAASHLLGQPITLDQLAQVMDSTRRSIHDAYVLLYPERHIITNDRGFISARYEGLRDAPTGSPTRPDWPRPLDADAI